MPGFCRVWLPPCWPPALLLLIATRSEVGLNCTSTVVCLLLVVGAEISQSFALTSVGHEPAPLSSAAMRSPSCAMCSSSMAISPVLPFRSGPLTFAGRPRSNTQVARTLWSGLLT